MVPRVVADTWSRVWACCDARVHVSAGLSARDVIGCGVPSLDDGDVGRDDVSGCVVVLCESWRAQHSDIGSASWTCDMAAADDYAASVESRDCDVA